MRDDPQRQSWLVTTLRDRDSDSRVALSLEPEWLAVEALFRTCHEGHLGSPRVSNFLVGELAFEIQDILKTRGEEASFSARKAGAVLQALGIKSRKLGNRGRGLVLNLPFQRKIHHLAREFGIDRGVLVSTQAVEAGYSGKKCLLCEEFGLLAGLRCLDFEKPRSRRSRLGDPVRKRQPIFD